MPPRPYKKLLGSVYVLLRLLDRHIIVCFVVARVAYALCVYQQPVKCNRYFADLASYRDALLTDVAQQGSITMDKALLVHIGTTDDRVEAQRQIG